MFGLRGHALAHVLVRNNHRAELGHGFIAGGVVAMKMRVDDVANRQRAELCHGVDDLLMHRRVHGVDEEDSVAAGGDGDVALRRAAHQDVEVVGDLDGLEIDGLKVDVLGVRRPETRHHKGRSDGEWCCSADGHGASLKRKYYSTFPRGEMKAREPARPLRRVQRFAHGCQERAQREGLGKEARPRWILAGLHCGIVRVAGNV